MTDSHQHNTSHCMHVDHVAKLATLTVCSLDAVAELEPSPTDGGLHVCLQLHKWACSAQQAAGSCTAKGRRGAA
jgi:hypothetical protein